jgi:putative transposase
MATQRKQYSAECKARVALAALKGHKTMNELVGLSGVHPTQRTTWKHHLQSELPQIFSTRHDKHAQAQEALTAQLSQPIGPLKVALDGLKKNLDWTVDAKRQCIEPDHPQSSVARQGELLGLPRSTYSSQSPGERPEHFHLMRLLDEQYTDTPYDGIRRMTAWLQSQGDPVNRKRVARCMHTLG